MVKPKLLIVDDSEIMCQFLAQYFGAHYRIQAFYRVADAWQWLDNGHFPNLIILDINMPEINGLEMLAQLKSSALFYDIPVIMLSSIDKSEERVRCLQSGAVDYVTKPFNPEELDCRVQFHLRMNGISLNRQMEE